MSATTLPQLQAKLTDLHAAYAQVTLATAQDNAGLVQLNGSTNSASDSVWTYVNRLGGLATELQNAHSNQQLLSAAIKDADQQTQTYQSNVGQLASMFNVTKSQATDLANSLHLNLTKALDPSDIVAFSGAALQRHGSDGYEAPGDGDRRRDRRTVDVERLLAVDIGIRVGHSKLLLLHARGRENEAQNVQAALKEGYDPSLILQQVKSGDASVIAAEAAAGTDAGTVNATNFQSTLLAGYQAAYSKAGSESASTFQTQLNTLNLLAQQGGLATGTSRSRAA